MIVTDEKINYGVYKRKKREADLEIVKEVMEEDEPDTRNFSENFLNRVYGQKYSEVLKEISKYPSPNWTSLRRQNTKMKAEKF